MEGLLVELHITVPHLACWIRTISCQQQADLNEGMSEEGFEVLLLMVLELG